MADGFLSGTEEDLREKPSKLISDWPLWLLLAADWGLGAWAALRMPSIVPAHWNLQGQVDGWGSRWETAFFFPAMATGVYAIMLFMHVRPSRAEVLSPASQSTKRSLRWILLAMLVGVHLFILAGALGQIGSVHSMGPWLSRGLFVVLALFAVLFGNLMPRMEPQMPATPANWSLRDLWRSAHRSAGRWLVGVGLIQLLAACILSALPQLLVFFGSYLAWTLVFVLRTHTLRMHLPSGEDQESAQTEGTLSVSRFDLLAIATVALAVAPIMKAGGHLAWMMVSLAPFLWLMLWIETRFLKSGFLIRGLVRMRGWVTAAFALSTGVIYLRGLPMTFKVLLVIALLNGLTGIGQWMAKRSASEQDQELWRIFESAGSTLWNPRDPRILVPKIMGLGWTYNFARFTAWFLLLGMFAYIALITVRSIS